jgi:hypothetical protein
VVLPEEPRTPEQPAAVAQPEEPRTLAQPAAEVRPEFEEP